MGVDPYLQKKQDLLKEQREEEEKNVKIPETSSSNDSDDTSSGEEHEKIGESEEFPMEESETIPAPPLEDQSLVRIANPFHFRLI